MNAALREEGSKRFTIAHEIGHFIIHRDRQISCLPSDIARGKTLRANPERQADSFASELLLPSAEVLKRSAINGRLSTGDFSGGLLRRQHDGDGQEILRTRATGMRRCLERRRHHQVDASGQPIPPLDHDW